MLIFIIAFLARDDIDSILDRLSKLENNNAMKDALAGAPMADNAVETILQAINDMQDKITADFDEKLKKYVLLPVFQDTEAELKALTRRVGHNEGQLKEQNQTLDGHTEKIETNRKKIAKLQAELDLLKQNPPKSSTALVEEVSVAESAADSEGAGDLGKLQKMIQRVEGNLIRRIAQVESSLSRIGTLEDDLVNMKLDVAKALKPKEPYITNEDVAKWNANCRKTDELEELLNNLLRDFQALDGTKIKADILQLFKVQQTFVVKE